MPETFIMTTDVVYTIGPYSKNNDLELRYSLRSLCIQPWVGKVFIVGYKPAWVKNVHHIPCGDPYKKSKDANIINKILLAASNPELSQRFVVNSDDQYFLKPVTGYELGPFLESDTGLAAYRIKAGANTWNRRVLESVHYCKMIGRTDAIVQSHKPYIVNKNSYFKAMSQIPWGNGNGFFTHVYFNLIHSGPFPKDPGNIVRRYKNPYDYKFIKADLENFSFLNHNDGGLSEGLEKYLSEKFKDASPWESQ
jgi:hypothetical protein